MAAATPTERRLKTWLSELEMVDAETERTTLNQLLEKFTAMNRGKAAKTQATNLSIIKQFRETWRPGLDLRCSVTD